MNDNQPELNFDGKDQMDLWRNSIRPQPSETQVELPEFDDDSGYQQWKSDLAQKKRSFEQRYGINLTQKVRVTLSFMDKELEGRISMQRLNNTEIRLKIRDLEFKPEEIEAIICLDEN